YLLDKVLFNTYPISSRILNRPNVKILFTIRKPAATITSIVKLGLDTRMRGRFWEKYQEPCRACDLYIARLHALEETCLAMKGKRFYFDGEDLIDRTEVILEALQRYLDVRQPLSEHYRTFGHTGVVGGDVSERIKSGRIDRSRSDGRNDVVPEHLIDRAQEA